MGLFLDAFTATLGGCLAVALAAGAALLVLVLVQVCLDRWNRW